MWPQPGGQVLRNDQRPAALLQPPIQPIEFSPPRSGALILGLGDPTRATCFFLMQDQYQITNSKSSLPHGIQVKDIPRRRIHLITDPPAEKRIGF